MSIISETVEGPQATPNFVPFVDFLLLLLLIAMSSGSEAETYALASHRPGVPDPQSQELATKDTPVEVHPGGILRIDGKVAEWTEVETRIRADKASHPGLIVFVDGHKDAPYGAVVRLEDLCDRLDVEHRRLVDKEP